YWRTPRPPARGAACRGRAASLPRRRRARGRARRRGGRAGSPSPCWSRTRSTRRARRSREESGLHERALRVVEALELLAAVLVFEGPSELERIRRAQLGLARAAGGEDLGVGRDRRVAGESRGAAGGAAEAPEE